MRFQIERLNDQCHQFERRVTRTVGSLNRTVEGKSGHDIVFHGLSSKNKVEYLKLICVPRIN